MTMDAGYWSDNKQACALIRALMAYIRHRPAAHGQPPPRMRTAAQERDAKAANGRQDQKQEGAP